MVSRLPLGLVALICMLALSASSTTVPVSHAATATSFTFAVGGDHGDTLTMGDGAASLSRLATSGSDFYLAVGDLSYSNAITGNTWCSQFKTSYTNPVEVLAGNHDTGEENGTSATRSYERYVAGCPHNPLLPPLSGPNCGPVVANCYGKEYYFDYPAVNPIARFIMISPVVYNVTGVCTPTTTIRCNSSWPGTSCIDTYGCWPYFSKDPHYTWVSDTIDSARASSTIKWVIVGMHKVCISAGDQTCSIGPDLLNLMISKKVDLVLEGHDHSYQRSKQLALNGSTCTGIIPTNSYPTFNSNCVANDGSTGIYTPGAGTVVVIQGTFGAPLNTVNDPSSSGCAPCAAEAPYFAKLMGQNTPGNGHGFMQYTVSADRIDAKSSFSGSFSDSFTIGKAFTLSSSPTSLVIQTGASSSSTITVTSQAGFTGMVSLSLSQAGCACVTSSITPTVVDLTTNPTGSALLQVNGLSPGGNVTLTVIGTSGAVSSSTSVSVSVQDFSISSNPPSLTLNFNGAGTSTINLQSLNNFAGTVTLTPTVSPQGLTFSLDKSSIPLAAKGSGTATLSITGSAPGNYTITVGAASGPTSHTATVQVRVLGDFTMSSTKSSLTLNPGSTDSSVVITLIGSGKYSGTVNLVASVSPTGQTTCQTGCPTASPAPPSLMLKASQSTDGTNSSILTVTAGTVSGTYRIDVTATSGLLFHSVSITLTVGKANPTITTTLSASTIPAGGSASDSATLTGATTTAGGTVTYSVFSGTVCSGSAIFVQTVPVTNGAVPSSRVVQFNVTGSFEWQATYSGDPNNSPSLPSSCGSELLTVKVTTTSVATTLSSNSIFPGGVVSDSATLTGFFGGFSTGGTATYSVYANPTSSPVCSGTPVFAQTVPVNSVNGAIANSRNVQFNATGFYQWQVSYSGDTNNGVSLSACGSESLSVGKASPTVTTTLSVNSIVVGNPAADTATIAGGTNPTGTVTFSVYSGNACSGTSVATKTVPLASGSAGPVSVIFNSTGTFNWQAVYNGDASNNVAQSACLTETLTVGKATPAVVEPVSATTIVVGNSANANATVSGGFSPTGTVTFSIFAGSTCSGTTIANKIIALASGTAGPFSVVFNSTGTFNWQATYNGDANNNPISACKSLVVNKITPIITTSLSSPSIQVGGSVSASASMTNSFQAGGTITYSYYSGSTCGGTQTVVGSPVTVSNGIVPNSASQTFSTAQPYSWNTLYSGDTNNNPATGSCALLTVNPKGVSIATSLSPATITVGGSVFDSATITMATSTAGGTVTYNLFTSGTCSGSPSIVSIVTVTNMVVPNSRPVTFNSTAPVSWNATYSGDPNNARASSPCEPLTVNKTNPTITTSLSPTPIIVGQSTIESASLTSSFQAGGSVNYLQFSTGTCSGSPTTVSTVTVTNNVIPSSSPINPVPSGTYGFEASYTGDANNNPIISSCASLAVNKASPTITATLSQNTIPVGSSVSDSASMTGGYQTGGTVTYAFFTGGSCIGTSTTVGSPVTVTNGVVPSSSAQTFSSAGPYSWNAAYNGDANNNAITSSCQPLTVIKASPVVSTTLSANPITVGGSVYDSATMTGSFQAGGTVTYNWFTGGTCAGTANVVSTVGVVNGGIPSSTSRAFSPAGPYSWNAVYSGDANNNGIPSSCEPLTVNPTTGTAIIAALSSSSIPVGGSVTASATLSGVTPGAGGTVTYNSFPTTSCTGTPAVVSIVTVTNGAVPGSAAKTFNSAGSFSWNATYSGDANNGAASSTCLPLTVNQAAPSITTTVSGNNVPVGTPVRDSATLSNGFNAGGTVTYRLFSDAGCTISGVVISTVTVANGVVPDSSATSPTPSGAYGFQASYTGDANNKPVTGACEPFTVSKASPAISTNLSLNSIPVGSSVSASASMTGGYQPGGTVTYAFFTGSSCTGTPTTVGSPVAVTNGAVPGSNSQTFNSAGAYGWNAVYGGDANNNAITSSCQPLTVNKASPAVSTTLSPNSITVGGSVYASATMTGAFQAGGSATYFLFTTTDCTGSQTPVSTVTVNSGAMPSSSPQQFASAGTFSWNTRYFGDSNNNPVTSGCALLTVNKASPTISTTLSATTITVGQSATDSAVINGGYNPGGTVTYNLFTTTDCSGTSTLISTVTISSGVVPNSASHAFTSSGSYSWGAVYNGDSNNNPSTVSCASLTVNPASGVVIAANLSQTTITVGGSVFDTATLTGTTPTAGGTVTYNLFSSGTCTGTSSVVQTVPVTNGIVPNSNSVTFSNTSPVSWNAVYSGDANNKAPPPSSCEPLSISRVTPTITTSISSQSIIVGGYVTGSATLSGAYGSAGGTVTYTLFTGNTCSGITTAIPSVTVSGGIVPSSAPAFPNSAGQFSWNAVYNGDGNNNPATSKCVGFTVNMASPTVANSLPASSTITAGQPVSNTATISQGFNTGGSVTYNLFNGACTGTATQIAVYTVTSGPISPTPPQSLTTGIYGWNIIYSGDSNNNPATSSCAVVTVIKTNPTITTTLYFPTINVGSSAYDSATLTGSFRATGTVTYAFYSGPTCSGTGIIVGSPVSVTIGGNSNTAVIPNSGSWTFSTAGQYSWNAAYTGDANNNGVTSTCEPLTVSQLLATVSISQVGSLTVGNSAPLIASLSGITSNAGGTVTYSYFSGSACGGTATVVGSPVTVSNGVVPSSGRVTFISAGTYSWNAVYSGDSNNGHATSLCGTVTVNKATPTVSATLSANVITKGGAASGSATLTGSFAAGGTLTYNQFSSGDCTGTANVVSTVTVTNNVVPSSSSTTFPADGRFSWNAIYSGDSNNGPATGPCRALTVTAPPLLSVPASPQPVNSGSPIRFTVTATDHSWNNLTLTASGLPAGASFPVAQSQTGSASSTFSWTPSDSQVSGDYKVTFTVDDGHGGKTSSQVTIHVTGINRSSPLNNAVPYFVVALVAGTALVLSAPLVLRRFRK